MVQAHGRRSRPLRRNWASPLMAGLVRSRRRNSDSAVEALIPHSTYNARSLVLMMTRELRQFSNDRQCCPAERTAAAIPSSAGSVPATLHASLMARLDRLGPAKELAQIGAVNRARVLSCFAGDGGPQAGGGTPIGARLPHGSRFAISPRGAAASQLSLQACADTGRGVRHAVARATSRSSCAYRRRVTLQGTVRQHRREPA